MRHTCKLNWDDVMLFGQGEFSATAKKYMLQCKKCAQKCVSPKKYALFCPGSAA